MPDQELTPESVVKAPEVRSGGLRFGCAIGIGGMLFFAGLIAFSIWQGVKRSELIDGFTSPEPELMEIARLPEADAVRLEVESAAFADALTNGTEYEWKLDVAELNHLIATDPHLGELKGQILVTKIEGDHVTAKIAYPINRLPWENGERFLNGEIDIHPEIAQKQPVPRVVDLRVPGKDVPDWFEQSFSVYNLMERFNTGEETYDQMRQLSSLGVKDGELVVRSLSWKLDQ